MTFYPDPELQTQCLQNSPKIMYAQEVAQAVNRC